MIKKRLARVLLALVCAVSMTVYAPLKMFASKEDALEDALKVASKYAIDFRNFHGRIVRRDSFIATAQEWLLDSLKADVVATEDFQKDARKAFGKVWNNVFFISMETADSVMTYTPQYLDGMCRAGKTCLDQLAVTIWIHICKHHDCELTDETLTKIIVRAAKEDERFTIIEDLLALGD